MRRSRHVFLPAVTIDRTAASPLHRQIRRQIESAIGRGAVDGARLPSSRVLARLLGVSRNTVLAAYDELVADGLICGKRGAAMMVTLRRAPAIDLNHLLRDAQYPARTLTISDADENQIDISY